MRRRPLPVPRDRTGRFVNWARMLRTPPREWREPRTVDDVVAIVRRSQDTGRRLRVVGAGHSWSPIAMPEDIAVTLHRLERPASLSADRTTVTVSGGTRLRDLSAFLAERGLSLPIVGSIQSQAVAGAIATGTHGSSLVHGNLAGLVTAMRLVTGTGDVVDTATGDAPLDGVRVHLGALGIVTEVTLKVHPARRLHQQIEHVAVDEVAAALPDIAGSAEYVKVWWLPHAPSAQVVRYDATDLPATRRPSAVTRRWIDDNVMQRLLFPLVASVHHRRPTTVARWNATSSRSYLGAVSQVGADILMLNTTMPLRHRETEAAIAMVDAGRAVADLLGVFRDGRPAANFPLEIRFVRGDQSWMSPAYGADTCQVGAYTTAGPDCDDYFEQFWQVMNRYDARPHWGKEMDHDAATLGKRYPRFDDFVRLRSSLDPDRVFASAFHDRILGAR